MHAIDDIVKYIEGFIVNSETQLMMNNWLLWYKQFTDKLDVKMEGVIWWTKL